MSVLVLATAAGLCLAVSALCFWLILSIGEECRAVDVVLARGPRGAGEVLVVSRPEAGLPRQLAEGLGLSLAWLSVGAAGRPSASEARVLRAVRPHRAPDGLWRVWCAICDASLVCDPPTRLQARRETNAHRRTHISYVR